MKDILFLFVIYFLLSPVNHLYSQVGMSKDGRKVYKIQKKDKDKGLMEIARLRKLDYKDIEKYNKNRDEGLDNVKVGDIIYLSDFPDRNVIMNASEEGLVGFDENSTTVQAVKYNGKRYVVMRFEYDDYDVDVMHRVSPDQARLIEVRETVHSFGTIRDLKKDKLVFAMNAGMFEQNLKPVGWLIADGKIECKINSKKRGYGNFYSLPFKNKAINGVFGIKDNGEPLLVDTRRLVSNAQRNAKALKSVTQSGPLLILDGEMNPMFNEGSPNLNRRNGVGINSETKEIVFIVSDDYVNFYDLSSLFSELGCDNALYLDGVVSTYYAPKLMGDRLPRIERRLSTFLVVSQK